MQTYSTTTSYTHSENTNVTKCATKCLIMGANLEQDLMAGDNENYAKPKCRMDKRLCQETAVLGRKNDLQPVSPLRHLAIQIILYQSGFKGSPQNHHHTPPLPSVNVMIQCRFGEQYFNRLVCK